MDPKLHRTLNGLRLAFRARKQECISEHGVGGNLPATLVTVQGETVVGSYTLYDDTAETTVETVISLSDCDTAICAADVYLALHGGDHDDDLAARFASGDESVVEALASVVVTRASQAAVYYDPYRFEGNQLAWGRPVSDPFPGRLSRDHGFVYRLHQGFQAQAVRPGPAVIQPGAKFVELGTTTDVHDERTYVYYLLHRPCVCGSGRPLNECCSIRN